jgi:dihydroorotase
MSRRIRNERGHDEGSGASAVPEGGQFSRALRHAAADAAGGDGPDDKFDLLIRNANVLDPSQNLPASATSASATARSRHRADASPPSVRVRVMDAGGKLVTPGLIDLHCHSFPYGLGDRHPADELVAHQCTTTVVSAGDAGANNFAAFRRFIVPASRTRQYAFVHIAVAGLAGFPMPELFNIEYAQVKRPRGRSPRTPISCSASRCE